ncbi:class I SAM-dependent methyltransferase [Enterococcus sp. LJL98]
MSVEKIEKSFYLNFEAIELLQEALATSFFDAYLEQVENVLDGYQVRVLDGVPDAQTVEKLQGIYQKLQAEKLEAEEIRKLTQWLLLKGTQKEPIQANHQLTPDSIGFLFVYLIEQFYPKKQETLTLLDPSVGTGNLLLTLLTNLSLSGYKPKGIGIDNDELLIAIAAANSQWVKTETLFYNQDAMQQSLADKADAVVADLPVGYYPIDSIAGAFETVAESGHTFAHHLLMEQGMKQTKEEGLGFFLLPSNFLESDQSDRLKKWLGKSVYLQGIIQLPDELFKQASSRKSLVILQNKGPKAQQAKEILVAQLSTLKDPKKVQSFFQQVTKWKQENL